MNHRSAWVAGVSRPSPTRRVTRALSGEDGSAILESAVAIGVLIAVSMALLWSLGIGIRAAQSAFIAREAARSLARGEDSRSVVSRAMQSSPSAVVLISHDAATVTVTVEQELIGGGLLQGRSLTIRQSATAWRET